MDSGTIGRKTLNVVFTGVNCSACAKVNESIEEGFISRARICKRLWSPGTDSAESISPAYVAWRAGRKNRVVEPARQAGNRFRGSLKGLQIRAQMKCKRGNKEESLALPRRLFNKAPTFQ